jgi:type II secretion system protein I
MKRGLSLLEVVLALTILGASLAVVAQLVRLGTHSAEEARELAVAQLLCESKLEEIAAGAAPCEAVSGTPSETMAGWQYTVTTSSLDQTGLLEVRVTVEQSESSRTPPLSFTLVRWMIDPSLQTSGGTSPSGTGGTSGTTSSTGTTGTAAGGSNVSAR